jgi:Na+-transporting NADH:ubiquinone oxidoreductase subunit NqrA
VAAAPAFANEHACFIFYQCLIHIGILFGYSSTAVMQLVGLRFPALFLSRCIRAGKSSSYEELAGDVVPSEVANMSNKAIADDELMKLQPKSCSY